MTTIKERVNEEVKTALKAGDKPKVGVLRLILAEFKRIEVDERITLDNTRELAILDKMQKQRRDSIEQFKIAKRDELVAQEQYELDLIQTFKPKALSEQEVKQVIDEAIKESGAASPQDMGKVMAIVKPKLQGRADMGQISTLIKSLLAG
jgi:uncharacterized protein YqeY